MTWKQVPKSVWDSAEKILSQRVGMPVRFTHHFKQRLFERFGGKLTMTVVKAITNAAREVCVKQLPEAEGIASGNIGTVKVPVSYDEFNDALVLKTVYHWK
jgi:hypothetical protein